MEGRHDRDKISLLQSNHLPRHRWQRVTQSIKDNLARVRERITAACRRVGRETSAVTLVAVTKTQPASVVDAVIEAGVADIGENRIQEFLDKSEQVHRTCRWHMIGTLQRNKATKAIGRFDLIHSVDTVRLAETLDRLGRERDATTRILLEVNTSRETTKHGFSPDEVIERAGEIARLGALQLEGLMTIGPLTDDATAVRRAFQSLFRLREKLEGALGTDLPHVSMGMTSDFETAIEEGATIVRLGRVLLGDRRA